jgi:steroid delta-isomerase-like uncharacterized protein
MKNIAATKAVAQSFFDNYNRHKIQSAVSLATSDATFRYVPLGQNGIGKIKGDSGTTWSGIAEALIGAFPDLSNEVKSVTVDDENNAIVKVFIGGTQAGDILGIPSKGRYYNVEHLFILKMNDDNKITDITCYWDNWDWFQQIGYNPALSN